MLKCQKCSFTLFSVLLRFLLTSKKLPLLVRSSVIRRISSRLATSVDNHEVKVMRVSYLEQLDCAESQFFALPPNLSIHDHASTYLIGGIIHRAGFFSELVPSTPQYTSMS